MERKALLKLPGKDDIKHSKVAACALLVVVALVSATLLRARFSSAETYSDIYETLDQRQNNVLSLCFGSAIISSAISALPDDMGTALSSEYADFYTGFAFIVGALLLEKYLLTTIGFGFFAIVIPICCLLMISSILSAPSSSTKYNRYQMAMKLFVFGLTLFLMTPASVFVSKQIDDTYRVSVEGTIEDTEKVTGAVEQVDEEGEAKGKTDSKEEDTNPLAFVQKNVNNATSAVSEAFESVGNFAKGLLPWAIQQLRTYAELFAVMVVTSIVIPLLVPVLIYLLFKVLFLSESGVTIPAPLVEALASGGSALPGGSDSQLGQLAEMSGGNAPEAVQTTLPDGTESGADTIGAESKGV